MDLCKFTKLKLDKTFKLCYNKRNKGKGNDKMIKINSDDYNCSVPLNSLRMGDTFLIEGSICMIAKRSGHLFVLDLSTGKDYCSINPCNSSQRVIPIECELSYRIK